MPATTTTTGIGLRRPPRQARSRARVDAIVNGLVELVHEGRGADLTTTEVAERAGIPIGSLYEYFEDLSSIVDAAVARMLDRHDEIVAERIAEHPEHRHEFVDVMFDAYLQLYSEQPAFIALRNSQLWTPEHRRWLTARVEGYLGAVVAAWGLDAATTDGGRPGGRISLVFAVGDAMLQRIFRDGPAGDADLEQIARHTLKFMIDNI
jgi:AcrR family transcriptional regulator